jgi:uncharacterized RDD family membrane protein YckC
MDSKEEATASAENTPVIALKFAPAWKRVLSYLIDELIIFIILFIFFTVILYYKDLNSIFKMHEKDMLNYLNNSANQQTIILLIERFVELHQLQIFLARLIIEASYFTLGWRGGGQTIGARIMKILVMTINKKRLTILQGFIRYILIYLSSLTFYLLQLIVFNSLYQQRIHDFFSASVVVEVPAIKINEGKFNREAAPEEDQK